MWFLVRKTFISFTDKRRARARAAFEVFLIHFVREEGALAPRVQSC